MNYPITSTINRFSKNNFPNIEELSNDVCLIINGKFHYQIKKQVIDGALWWMADYAGKGVNCQFKSKSATERIAKGDMSGFVHEHIIPKKLIREELMTLSGHATIEMVEKLLRLSIYCLVTKEEDMRLAKKHKQIMPSNGRMNENASPAEIWARYSAEGIDVR